MSSTSEAISRFTANVGDTINVTFKNISDFIDTIVTFFTSLGFWTSVLVFLIIFLLLMSAPLIVFKYWDGIISSYKKVIDKVILSISSR